MTYTIENGVIFSYSERGDEDTAILPADAAGIGQRAFADAPFRRILLPEGLQRIEAGAFSGCASLEELEIPASVHSISTGAFSGCASLEKVALPEQLPVYGEHLFTGCPSLRLIKGLQSGSAAEYDPGKGVLTLHSSGGGCSSCLAGFFVDSALLRGGTVLRCLDEGGKCLWALWLPGGESSDGLREGLRSLLYTAGPVRFSAYDDLYRCVKDPRNRMYFALYRLLYPVEMDQAVSIMFRNQLRRSADECACALIEDGRMEELRAAAAAGLLNRAGEESVLRCAALHGCEEAVRAALAARPDGDDRMEKLTSAQVRALNSPVYARLRERQEKLRRASLERLARSEGGLGQLLLNAVRADDRTRVRYYLASNYLDASVLFDAAALTIQNNDVYMLQDLTESAHGFTPSQAALLLEQAVIGGKTEIVTFLCAALPEIGTYNRALGYAMRQADFRMAQAILQRKDQRLKTAESVRAEFTRRMDRPEQAEMARCVIDLGFVEYSYFDDDFRYFFLNTGRNGLVGDEFYETHYVLVRLAGIPERIAFLHKMADAGLFGEEELRYLCYLAADADEIPLAKELVSMGVSGFDVRRCSVIANQQTILDSLGDMFTSNPKRPSDEKFSFIISQLKPGEKLKLQVRYLLKTANVGRALTILKHSSPENCEDMALTIRYFTEHNSLEAIELLCQWGLSDECFLEAQAMKNTEIVAWILNYQNLNGGHEDVDDRFDL